MEIILISGSQGLLGQQIRDSYLMETDKIVVGFDISPHNTIRNKRFIYVQGSLLNERDLMVLSNKLGEVQKRISKEGSISAIINCIAEPDFQFPDEEIPKDLAEKKWPLWGWKNYPSSEFLSQLSTNVVGVHKLLTTIFENFLLSKNCSIINFVSQYAIKVPNQDVFKGMAKFTFKGPGYSSSKASLVSYTEYLAHIFSTIEGGGIRVNSLALGAVFNGNSYDFTKQYSKSTLTGRMMNKEEVIPIVKFLASEASNYINGSCLVADGGWSIK